MNVRPFNPESDPRPPYTAHFDAIVRATADQLTQLLGKPYEEPDDKTFYEWDGAYEKDGTIIVFHVYDWKRKRRPYNDEPMYWNIGHFSPEDANTIKNALEDSLSKL